MKKRLTKKAPARKVAKKAVRRNRRIPEQPTIPPARSQAESELDDQASECGCEGVEHVSHGPAYPDDAHI